jgi:hypothetical protein
MIPINLNVDSDFTFGDELCEIKTKEFFVTVFDFNGDVHKEFIISGDEDPTEWIIDYDDVPYFAEVEDHTKMQGFRYSVNGSIASIIAEYKVLEG